MSLWTTTTSKWTHLILLSNVSNLDAYIDKWLQFCAKRESNPYDPPVSIVLDRKTLLLEVTQLFPEL